MREQDSWCGETNIQKACFFLQEVTQVPLDFDFILYKYGPYSFDLTDELTALRADSILGLRVRDLKYGPCYVPGELSDLVKRRFRNTVKRHEGHIRFVASKLGTKNVQELECLATALYVTLDPGETKAQIAERASEVTEVKPHISMDQAQKAVREIDAMLEEAVKLQT
jgi:uncharacterized protein YwgA